jgi:hypothetical protein
MEYILLSILAIVLNILVVRNVLIIRKENKKIAFDNYIYDKTIELKKEILDLEKKPSIAIVQIGNDENDTLWITMYKKRCDELGIDTHWYTYDETKNYNFVQEIEDIGGNYDGVVIKLCENPPITHATAYDAIPNGKNIMKTARATGITQYLEYKGESVKDITITAQDKVSSTNNDMRVHVDGKLKIGGKHNLTYAMVEELGFIESINNVINAVGI